MSDSLHRIDTHYHLLPVIYRTALARPGKETRSAPTGS
jgi:hypothetical protein